MIHSHTSLSAFKTCPRQFYHKYVAKDLPFESTPALEWGNKVHSAMEARLKDGMPLPDDMPYESLIPKIPLPMVEEKMGMSVGGKWTGFFAGDCWLRGKADAVFLNETRAFILDWKTGKVREDPTELETFAVLLKAQMPGLEHIAGAYVWLNEMRMGAVYNLDTTRRRKEIDATAAAIAECEASGHWPENKSGLCKAHCAVFSCQFNGRKS